MLNLHLPSVLPCATFLQCFIPLFILPWSTLGLTLTWNLYHSRPRWGLGSLGSFLRFQTHHLLCPKHWELMQSRWPCLAHKEHPVRQRQLKEVGPQIVTRRRCHRETLKGGRRWGGKAEGYVLLPDCGWKTAARAGGWRKDSQPGLKCQLSVIRCVTPGKWPKLPGPQFLHP